MPKFKGVHQPFHPNKPYWIKDNPKTDLQKRYFEKMGKAVKGRKRQGGCLNNNNQNADNGPQQFEEMRVPELDDIDINCIPAFIEEIHQARLEDERRERALALERAAQEMFSAYIECHLKTSEWGDHLRWDFDHKPVCNCHPSQRRSRNIDLVNLLTRRKALIQFCSCQYSDQTRLIYMGYIGGSPKSPQTAFSIRLLRFYHLLWKFCSTRLGPFAWALDEFLDAWNPLILTKNQEPRRWQTPLHLEIDAYRQMLTMLEQALDIEMSLAAISKLAENCPRCFGPPVRNPDHPLEPDIIVCMDGNFQRRRHITAGTKQAQVPTKMPTLFLPEEQVNRMEARLAGHPEDDFQACAEQHTAANDKRGKGHWGGCDETGLMGMACRHDHALRFANIRQSGEKLHFSYSLIEWILDITRNHGVNPSHIGFLYDIGCTMQAGILKRGIFADDFNTGRLKFGTSVFHAYVHRWTCQLLWNPRLNPGWGLSDGEGEERIWSGLDPLVAPLRYATPQHRVDAIAMRSAHFNTCLRHEAVKHVRRKHMEVRKRLAEAEDTLRTLALPVPGEGLAGHPSQFFENEWNAQRTKQLDVMTETTKQKREKLLILLKMEEELVIARGQLRDLQSKTRRARTQAEKNELLALPGSIVDIERQIEAMANALGGAEFGALTGPTGNVANATLAISLARDKMYEAKVGLVECRIRRHLASGTRQSQHMSRIYSDKTRDLLNKYNTYARRVRKFRADYPRGPRFELPDYETVMGMEMEDQFWNRGEVDEDEHQTAENVRIRQGIDAFLRQRSAQEEIRRISREVRQMLGWAIEYHGRIMVLKEGIEQGEQHIDCWDDFCFYPDQV
ncbi:hypothetical protein DFH28DRAFT_1088776 [Melampsora americana]|nr:hypothetical protein DFH28DRAFT_1088776 [Melampsora americana]